MKPRHLLSVRDLTADQILDLFRAASQMKKDKKHARPLLGKTLGLLFQKPSVRTRVSFEVGMAQLGGQSLYIGPVELQEGKRESSKDLAQVLSRYLDGIVARTFSHRDVVQMAEFSTIPVINGLSDESHPCQALADFLTIQEKFGKCRGITISYVGDGNNVCSSLLETAVLLGANFSVATPQGYNLDRDLVRWAVAVARKTGSRVFSMTNPHEAVRGADVVYTDVWTSMGQEKEKIMRHKIFQPFKVNAALFRKAARGALFMHCLPAHRGEEVTNEVMDSSSSIVYDQAENRLHLQKAVLLMLLG